MAGNDDPPFLNVGTEVSAKYRGAFCEAKIKIAKKHVKCKVCYHKGQSDTVSNDIIKGPLKVGANVEVRQSDGQYVPAVVQKLTDSSTYTVEFDDGDERTLKRSSLVLKGGRHYSESESLDQMPLTDPENFGTPVQFQSKRGYRRRNPANGQSSSSPEQQEVSPPTIPAAAITRPVSNSKKSHSSSEFPVGKCVFLENDRRRLCWLPAVVVPTHFVMDKTEAAQDTICIRSFKDGRFFASKVSELHDFAPDKEPLLSMLEGEVQPMYMCKPAIERAMAYLDTGELPWNMDLFDGKRNISPNATSDQERPSLTDEQKASKEQFQEKLKKFHDERGTTLKLSPLIASTELDLHKLYNLVRDNGGMEKVTQELKWRSLYLQMGLPPITNSSYMIKQAYKKYLNAFEIHEKAKEDGKPLPIKNYRKRSLAQGSDDDQCKPVKKEKLAKIEEIEKLKEEIHVEPPPPQDVKPELELREIKSEVSTESDTDSVSQAGSMCITGEERDGESQPRSDASGDSVSSEGGIKKNDGKDLSVGDRVSVTYGKGKTQRFYEAKINDIDKRAVNKTLYLIHYNGWNARYDEWVERDRIMGKVLTPSRGPTRPPYSKKKPTKLKPTSKKAPPPGAASDSTPLSRHTHDMVLTPPISMVTTPTATPVITSHSAPSTTDSKTSNKQYRRRRTSSTTETSSGDALRSPDSLTPLSSVSSVSSNHTLGGGQQKRAPFSPLSISSPPIQVPALAQPDHTYKTIALKVEPESTTGRMSDTPSEEDCSHEIKKEESINWLLGMNGSNGSSDSNEGEDIDNEGTKSPEQESDSPPSLTNSSSPQPEKTNDETIAMETDPASTLPPTFSNMLNSSLSTITQTTHPTLLTSTSAETTQSSSHTTSESSPISSIESSSEDQMVPEQKISPSKRPRGTPRKRASIESLNGTGSESEDHQAKRLREDLDFSIDKEMLASLDTAQRISLIQEKIKGVQKRYMELKAEVTYLERKRRKARRKEREAAKQQQQQNQQNDHASNDISSQTAPPIECH